MGVVLRFSHHATSRSRAAKEASNSAVTPFSWDLGNPTMADQNSAGIRSRCSHLRTAIPECPTSTAKASQLGQSSIIERNDVSELIHGTMGQSVPKVKANVSRDVLSHLGHHVLMKQDPEELAESVWREQFRLRVIEAQEDRPNDDMADLLGMKGPNRANTYSKYRARGSMMPTRYLLRFCKICQVRIEWLIEGEPHEKWIKKPTGKAAVA
jgi:hypothetical protein